MERWRKGVLGVVILDFITLLMSHALYREIGWVPLGLVSFVLLYLVIRLSGYTREELGLGGGFDLRLHILLPLFTMLMSFLWIIPLGIGINTFGRPPKITLLIYIAMLVKYLIFVALYEELMWRGLFQVALEEKLGRGWKAVLITAFLFALGHLTLRPSFWRFYNPFLLGILYSVYRWKFRRIEGLVLAHGLGDFLDRIMTIEKVDWLTKTPQGIAYLIGTFTVTQMVLVVIYLKIAERVDVGKEVSE